jgi:hypothetical protein
MVLNTSLKSFLVHLLTRHGALVETGRDSMLEVLFPPALAQGLGVGELERFAVPEGTQAQAAIPSTLGIAVPDARLVNYQSELLERLGQLCIGPGAVAAAALAEPIPVKKLDVEHDIARAVALQNAVLKAYRQEPATIPYLLCHFTYAALSDERHEGMVALAVNEHTLQVVTGLAELVPELPLSAELPPDGLAADVARVYTQACHAAQSRIEDDLVDFVKSMNRRLNRDVQRLTEYYGAMAQEIDTRLHKKRLAAEEQTREQSRRRATELELDRKIRDLQAKYALTVRVDLVGVLRLFVPVMLVSLTVMRRKWTLPLVLAWNPLLRELERVTCMGCFRPSKAIFICDEQRHAVCPTCFAACPTCQHPCCRACVPHGCRRCQKAALPATQQARHAQLEKGV